MIPKLSFNIFSNYQALQSAIFHTEGPPYQYKISKAWQATAFVLNGNGAAVESRAEADATPACKGPEHPAKKLRFDRPFFIMLKRRDQGNPYFAMWVANTEFMHVNK